MKTLAVILIVMGLVIAVTSFYFVNNGDIIVPRNNSTNNLSPAPGNTLQDNSQLSNQTYNIKIQDMEFVPGAINIKRGDTIIWTNQDSEIHTITSDSGSELSSNTLSKNQTYSHTFNTIGTFNYHCSVYTSIKAKVIVS